MTVKLGVAGRNTKIYKSSDKKTDLTNHPAKRFVCTSLLLKQFN